MVFKKNKINDDQKNLMIQTAVWQEECPVSIMELTNITIKHYDFNGNEQIGEIIAHNSVADDIIFIFKELYAMKFPINKAQGMEHYKGSDELAMQDNNSSCFNYRKIAGTDRFSMHAYGLALDINPLQNPMIANPGLDDEEVHPLIGKKYCNRDQAVAGFLEPVVELITSSTQFKIWGGNWSNPIDYHHFQTAKKL